MALSTTTLGIKEVEKPVTLTRKEYDVLKDIASEEDGKRYLSRHDGEWELGNGSLGFMERHKNPWPAIRKMEQEKLLRVKEDTSERYDHRDDYFHYGHSYWLEITSTGRAALKSSDWVKVEKSEQLEIERKEKEKTAKERRAEDKKKLELLQRATKHRKDISLSAIEDLLKK